MNREFKFRAWDTFHEEMIIFPHKTRDLVFTDKGPNIICFHRGIRLPLNEDRELILMQYTGLKDSEGKEIYEGDVVIGKTDYPNQPKFVIDYVKITGGKDYDTFAIGFDLWIFKSEELTVIGNIYENPELMEE